MNHTTIRAAFLVLATLALGCDSEGVSAYVDAPDAGAMPGRGGGEVPVVADAVTVQPDAGIPSQDTRPMVAPDTMPTIARDTMPAVQVDTKVVAMDTTPETGLDSLRKCPAARVYSSKSVCSGKWQGDGKSFCIQGGQDADGVIYGQVVQYGESPCTAMGVSDSVSGRVMVVVIPAGACDTFCKLAN